MSSVKRGRIEEVALTLMNHGLQITFNRDIAPRTEVVAIGQSDGSTLTYCLYVGEEYVGVALSKWDSSRGQVEVAPLPHSEATDV